MRWRDVERLFGGQKRRLSRQRRSDCKEGQTEGWWQVDTWNSEGRRVRQGLRYTGAMEGFENQKVVAVGQRGPKYTLLPVYPFRSSGQRSLHIHSVSFCHSSICCCQAPCPVTPIAWGNPPTKEQQSGWDERKQIIAHNKDQCDSTHHPHVMKPLDSSQGGEGKGGTCARPEKY